MCALEGKDYALNMVRNIYRLKLIKMIKTRESVNTTVTPKTITTSMIDADLKDGLNKRDMMEKYNIRKWEIDRIFKNPKLTGRRPSPKLSFTFVDDMDEDTVTVTEDTVEEATSLLYGVDNTNVEAIVDPNQITLEDAIDEATEHDSEELDTDDSGLEIPTLADTMELVEEQEQEAGSDFDVDSEEEEEITVEEGDEFDSFEL